MQVNTFRQLDNPNLLLPIITGWKSESNIEAFNISTDDKEILDDLIAFVYNPDGDLIVLREDEKIIGIMGMYLMKNRYGTDIWANENYWYVLPEYRKGRGGLMLLNYSREWARERGATKELRTASNLASDKHDTVCKVYERLGMKKLETTYIGGL